MVLIGVLILLGFAMAWPVAAVVDAVYSGRVSRCSVHRVDSCDTKKCKFITESSLEK